MVASINGLQQITDYLNPDQQQQLLQTIDHQTWRDDLKRRVQHYGYIYDYKKRTVTPDMHLGALPAWADDLAHRLQRDGFVDRVPDQVIVNEYQPGQGISSHIDCTPCFGDTVLSISLGAACVMHFIRSQDHFTLKVPVILNPGSLLVMRGEARYNWKHGIPARKTDTINGRRIERGRRVSLTFRNVCL